MKRRTLARCLTALMLTAGVLGGMAAMAFWRSPPRPIPRTETASPLPPVTPPSRPKVDVWAKIAPRLRQVEGEATNAKDRHLRRINDFFAEKTKHVRPFAENLLGWSGKWAFVKSKISGDEGKGHGEFLQKTFDEHLFSERELKELIQSVVTAYLSDLEGQENALLVAIRADLCDQDLPELKAITGLQSDEVFRGEYQKMLAEVTPVISRDLNVTLGRELAVFVGSEIAAAVTVRIASAVAVRLGVSGGILGTGAASSVGTFGIGLAIGFAVDGVLDWGLRQAGYDPAAEIAKQTSTTLDQVRRLLLDGEGSPGLRQELTQLAEFRGACREQALKKIVLTAGR